jgi:diguanylate cyclase (GGDEF)-like protein
MKTNKAVYTIGVLMGNVHSPHTVELLQGMSEAAKEVDVEVLYFLGTHSGHMLEIMMGRARDVDYDYQFNTIYDYALISELDALVIAYGSLCIFLEDMDKDTFVSRFKGIPYLLLEEESTKADFLIADNYGGMTQIAEHLMRDHGYTRFVYLSGPSNNLDAQQRLQAFMDTCERYGITLPEDAIEYGNYSQAIWSQVTRLLDAHPDAQALVCANDEMALGAYEVCEARGLRIGEDIAITGFDNSVNAKAAMIPLTTVEQDGFSMGYQSIMNALKICQGEYIEGHKIPTRLIRRISCGCKEEQHLDPMSDLCTICEERLEMLSDEMTRVMIRTIHNQAIYEKCLRYVKELMHISYALLTHHEQTSFHKAEVRSAEIIQHFTEGKLKHFLSLDAFREEMITWYHLLDRQTDDMHIKIALDNLLLKLQKTLQMRVNFDTNFLLRDIYQKSWFVQIIAREMTERLDDEYEFFLCAVKELKELGAKSAYLYITRNVMVHHKGDPWKCPEKMYLAAYHSGETSYSYRPEDRPVVSASHGFSRYLCEEGGQQLYSFILFSQARQYGLLLCEIEPSEVSILFYASLQIGTALRFLELHKGEMGVLQTIREQNTVLSLLSEYDGLTNLYNRKGFMERALKLNRRKKLHGERAVFLFADLDHLKEINDSVGHLDGDYAICKAGELLKSSLSDHAIVGRIGGDEFVAMDIAGLYDSCEALDSAIHLAFDRLNQSSGKPYYVEVSVGYYYFTLGEELDFTDIMSRADRCLYQNKKGRRESVMR